MPLNMSSRPRDNLPPLEHRFSGENAMRTLLYLYQGQRGQLALASLCFVIKHSPVWLMPAITAHTPPPTTRTAASTRSARERPDNWLNRPAACWKRPGWPSNVLGYLMFMAQYPARN